MHGSHVIQRTRRGWDSQTYTHGVCVGIAPWFLGSQTDRLGAKPMTRVVSGTRINNKETEGVV